MAAPPSNSDPTASAGGACHRRLVVRRWFLVGWNRAWDSGNRSCRVLFGGYRADVRFVEAQNHESLKKSKEKIGTVKDSISHNAKASDR
jgi:hypothetical protein